MKKKKIFIGVAILLSLITSPFVYKFAEKIATEALYKNFSTKNIKIKGQKITASETINNELEKLKKLNVFQLRIQDIKNDFEKIPWIKNVNVKRKLPNNLEVEITEVEPLLVVNDKEKFYVVDRDLEIFYFSSEDIRNNLELEKVTYVEGKNAKDNIIEIAKMIQGKKFYKRISGFYRISDRRWDMVIDRRIRLMLPEGLSETSIEQAIELADSLRKNGSIKRESIFSVVDIRLKNKTFVRNIGDNT